MALSAGHRVAHTTELLENILQQMFDLPSYYPEAVKAHRSLLLSQRTCKAFQNVIVGSPKLRQQLFLSPPAAAIEPGNIMNASFYNPLLRCHSPCEDWNILTVTEFSVTHAWFSSSKPLCDGLRYELRRFGAHNPDKPSTSEGVSDSWRAMYAWNRSFKMVELIVDGKMVGLPKEGLENPTMGEIFDVAFAAE